MDCKFQTRKNELEAECKLPTDALATVSNRLTNFMKPFLENYSRSDQQAHAMTVVRGLCSDLERKNGESIAYLFGLDRKAIQYFVGESKWNDRPLRDELARQIGSELAKPDGVLAFDPSSFPKSGKQSVGVARQWCGRLGKIENCQVGVYLAYVSSQGHAIVDTELYLPKEWTNDKKRMKRAGVPKEKQRYRTRHEICLELLDRNGSQLPHTWLTGDDELGRPAGFRRELRDRNEQYLLAVPCNTTIRDLEIPEPEYSGKGRPGKRPSIRVDRWTAQQADQAWTRLEVRDGEKGPLIVDVLKRRVETGKRGRATVAEEELVVIRYKDRDEKVVKTDYYLSNASHETPLIEFCRAAKAEHRVEECFQRAKGETGLADYEVRNWPGWHHHQTLSLLASWYLTVETRRAEKKDTSDYVQSDTNWDRLNSSQRTEMRYTPSRQPPHRTTINTKSNRQTLPLEIPQQTTT